MTRFISRETRSVAIPSEHGGWSLVLEPAILGLLVAFSGAGAALAAGALLSFIARTPLRVVLVDRWRGRRLDRTQTAERILTVELLVIFALAILAFVTTATPFWWPLAVAAPLIVVELWHDMRSRSRHLIPELAGTIGVGSVATAIALAGSSETGIAFGLWVV
ncbi:MAG: YwiC-like family protein, partial [Acidimicrobiia bacterium]